jgi:hypothetical protein
MAGRATIFWWARQFVARSKVLFAFLACLWFCTACADPSAVPGDYSTATTRLDGLVAAIPYPSSWRNEVNQSVPEGILLGWYGPEEYDYFTKPVLTVSLQSPPADKEGWCQKQISDETYGRIKKLTPVAIVNAQLSGTPASVARFSYIEENASDAPVKVPRPETINMICSIYPQVGVAIIIELKAAGSQQPVGDSVFQNVTSGTSLSADRATH